MRIPKMPQVNGNKNYIDNEDQASRKENLKLRDALREIIDQRKVNRLENDKLSKMQDEESIKFQTELLKKLESDQSYIMNTFVKNPTEKLNPSIKPNHAISVKILDKSHNDYVHLKMKDKLANDELEYSIRQKIKLQKMKEIQAYQRLQMSEKQNKQLSSDHMDRILSKEIVSRDLSQMSTFDSTEKLHRRQKAELARKLLDEQIQADQEFKNSTLGLDSKEYALNANKIRRVIEKY